MRKVWRFRQPLSQVEIVRRADASPAEIASSLPAGVALASFRSLFRDHALKAGNSAAWIFEMSDLPSATIVPATTDLRWIQGRVEEAILRGRLLFITRALPTGFGIGVTAPEEGETPPPEEPKKDEEKKTWIEIELQDLLGEPIPNERYVLTLADGTVKKGRLDKKGFVRHDNIPEGDCKVTFPGFDGREWSPK